MTEIWNACVQAASNAFGISQTMAKLFVIALFTWMGLMILETWLVWAGLIAAVAAVLGLLLVLEYPLRAWYAIRDRFWPPTLAAAVSSHTLDIPDRPLAPCADAQGRIEKNDLPGQNVNAMADQILRKACVQKVAYHRPLWLCFPGISRAMPRLAAAGRVVFEMLDR